MDLFDRSFVMTAPCEVTSFRHPPLRARNAPQSNVEGNTSAPGDTSGSGYDTVHRSVLIFHDPGCPDLTSFIVTAAVHRLVFVSRSPCSIRFVDGQTLGYALIQ